MGILPYVLNMLGKEMKINFLPVLYIKTPSEQGLTRTKRNEYQFSASAVHQNTLRARSYPKEHTLAKARAGLFQGECVTWMTLPHSNF